MRTSLKHDPSTVISLLEMFCDGVMDSRPRSEVIDRSGPGAADPYIQRWYLGRKVMVPFSSLLTRGSRAGAVENVYLHLYGKGDDDALHCHPWDNATLVVRGWIREELHDGATRFLTPGDIVTRTAEEQHRIIEVEPGTVTLFGTLAKRREWGFYVDGNFIPHREFIASERSKDTA